jgi:hypothetical protein
VVYQGSKRKKVADPLEQIVITVYYAMKEEIKQWSDQKKVQTPLLAWSVFV